MRHEHYFQPNGTLTIMRDVFAYKPPLGYLGKLADALVLKQYLRKFLQERCNVVKQYAESGAWRELLPLQTSVS